ncbi:DUF6118 family protein [Pelagerythrobacter aerophilus]
MTDQAIPGTDAADAFGEVRSELTLLHSAVQGLTAAREKTPDYSATLGEMADRLNDLNVRLYHIEKSRALSLSPAALADEINAAAGAVRAQDRKMLEEASGALNRSLGWINGMINRGQAVERRIEREWMIGVGGMFAGMLLWSILPGLVVRSLPESWHAPEWMAAQMMGMDKAEAGKRLVEAAEKADDQ